MNGTNRILSCLLGVLILIFTGCGDPPLFSLKGKVTLGGEPKDRLIVYFNPVDRQVDLFNLGVGETDANGNLTLRSSAGNGLAAGKYRVSFMCMVDDSGQSAGGLEDKNEDANYEVRDLVPAPYNDRQQSPVEFDIKRTENEFHFDIPLN